MNKIIHYFWFGHNPKPDILKKCIKSWKKWLPDWEIKEWNETNVDVYLNDYTSYAYLKKNWSFVSDFFRCYILEKYGGLYLDTDVEIIGDIESLLKDEPIMGFEYSGYVASGLIMYFPQPHHKVLKDMMSIIELKSNTLDDPNFKSTMVVWFSDYLKDHGLINNGKEQYVEGIHIYPNDYFCPINPTWKFQKFTSNTVTIHHYYGSWFSSKAMNEYKIKRIIFKVLHPINFIKLVMMRLGGPCRK